MSYKNPTLYEIYIRILFQAGTFPITKIFDVVPKLRDTELSNIEFIQSVHGPVEGEPPSIEPRVRCWDDEKLRLVQLSRDIIIVNQTKKYLGWSTFQKLIHATLEVLRISEVELNFDSINLQTRDKFVVAKQDFKLGDWLNCDGKMIPQYYADSVEACDINIGRAFVNVDGWNRQLDIDVRPKGKEVEIRFDSGFHKKVGERTFKDVINDLHEESNASFESIITERVRKEIMHGQV